jgi:hypothetical protein
MKSPLKIIIACVVGLVILGGLGWFVFLPQFTKGPEAQIAALIKALPGDFTAQAIKVSSMDKSVSINGLAGTFPYKGKTLSLRIDSILGQGLAMTVGQNPGPEKLLDSLRVSGVTLEGPSEAGARSRVGFTSLLLENIQADISEYIAAGGEGQAALQKLLDSLIVDRVQLEGLDGAMPVGEAAVPASFSAAALQFAKVTAKEYGSLAGQSLAFSLGQGLSLKAAKASSAAINLPALLRAVAQSRDKGDADMLYQTLVGELSPLKDLGLEPLAIRLSPAAGVEFASLTARLPEKALLWSGAAFQCEETGLALKGTGRTGHYGGIALDLKNPDGATLSVGVLSLKDIAATMRQGLGEAQPQQDVTVADVAGRGLRANLSKIADVALAVAAAPPAGAPGGAAPGQASANATAAMPPDPAQDLPDAQSLAKLKTILALLSALGMDQMVLSKYTTKTSYPNEQLELSTTMERMEYNDVSLLHYGPMLGNTLVTSIANVLTLRIEEFSTDGMKLPDIVALAALDPATTDYGREIMVALTRQPLVISGLTLEKTTLEMPPVKAELGKFALDLEFGTARLLWRQELDGLLLPPQLYAMFNQDAALFAADYKKPLMLDGVVDIAIEQAAGKGELTIKEFSLSERDLVDCGLKASLPFTGKGEGLEGLLREGPEVFLRSATARLEDKGLLEALLHMQYSVMQAKKMLPPDSTTATLRQSVLASLRPLSQLQGITPDLQKIVLGLMKLVEAPGILDVQLTPTEPVNLEQLLMQGGKLPLGADVRYTPGQ